MNTDAVDWHRGWCAGISLARRRAFENQDFRADDMANLCSRRSWRVFARWRYVTLETQLMRESGEAGFVRRVEISNMAAAASEAQNRGRGQDGFSHADQPP